MRRLALGVLAGIVALAALALLVKGLGALGVLRGSGPPKSQKLALAGLQQGVRVVRDAFGVPHVQAATPEDAMRGLGFVHAQDRLWQMEVLRRAARGRLSELFGGGTLEQDRLARTLGIAAYADREAEALAGDARKLLDAYAQGVNAWIERLREAPAWMPGELRWLEHDPEPWTRADSLAIVRLRAFLLSRSLGASLLLERLNRDLGGEGAQDFFPSQPVQPPAPPVAGTLLELGALVDRFAAGVGLDGPVGSLGFVIGASRSASGRPLLLNDPHVEFRMPALFYFAHVETPRQSIAGGTWPGVPVFWMGHNRRIAWGQVALHVVVADLFDEILHPKDPDLYEVNGVWTRVKRRTEEIRVRAGAAQSLDVVTTRHGPLIGPLLPDDPRVAGYSLRWTGLDSKSGIDSLLDLQNAAGWTAFRQSLRAFPGPPSTFLYADIAGNIGTQVSGFLPLRAVPPRLLSVPGAYDWSGFVPFDELPSSFGASIPWRVVSTTGDGSKFAHPTEWLWGDGGATEQLEAQLGGDRMISLDDALAIQRDLRSRRGVAEVRDLLSGLNPRSEPARRVAEILRGWNGSTQPDVSGVSVYHVFRQRLAFRLLEKRMGPSHDFEQLARDAEPLPGVLMSRFLDRVAPQVAAELIEAALDDTWTWMGLNVSSNPKRWSWGELHRVKFPHAFEELGGEPLRWVARLLSRGPYPAPGDPDSIWTMYHTALPTDRIRVGPAARYAVDLGDLSHAQIALAGGQSGHAGSEHYDDGIAPWLRGEAWPLWMHRIDVAYHEVGVWELAPPAAEETSP